MSTDRFTLYGDHRERTQRLLELGEDAGGRVRDLCRLLEECGPAGDYRDRYGATIRQLIFVSRLAGLGREETLLFSRLLRLAGGLSLQQAGYLIDTLKQRVIVDEVRKEVPGILPEGLRHRDTVMIQAILMAGGDRTWVRRDEVIATYNHLRRDEEKIDRSRFWGRLVGLVRRGLVRYEREALNPAGNIVYAPHLKLSSSFAEYLLDHDLGNLVRDDERHLLARIP